MSTCRSCGAPITWAKTDKGKAMPLDAEPTPAGNLELDGGRVRFVTPDANATTSRYTSHFATCPDAVSHRRPRA